MSPSHAELMQELLPMYNQDPERFMRFYNTVYLKLIEIPEGGELRIAEHFRPASMGVFLKVASLCIIEDTCRKSVTDDLLEFSDDYTMVRKCRKFTPSAPLRKTRLGL